MLLFSDGDDQSSHATFEAAIARAEGSDATIYAIGQGRAVRTQELRTVLKKFATTSGGREFFAEDAQRLDRFFEEILEDLSNQYLGLVLLPLRGTRRSVALDSSRGRERQVSGAGEGWLPAVEELRQRP